MWTCRARASSAAGTSPAVSVATAPVAVRIARSPPADSATVIPVGASARTATKDVSTPSAASCPSMNRPAGSSPTAAASATRSPSRAAATAVIEADPPTSSEIPSTSFSCWPKAGVTSPPTTITSGLQSPMTSRSSAPVPAGPRSGGDNLDPGVGQPGGLGRCDAGVGDQDVHLGGRADPGERAPTHLGTVRGHHHLGRPPGHQPADARLALVVRHGPGHRVDPVHPEERDVQGDLLQDASGQRAGQLVGLRPGHPAGSHDLDVLADGELCGDVQRVGDDGEPG